MQNPDLDVVKLILDILQSLFTSIAIVIGGWWAYRNFNVKREITPKAQVDISVAYNGLLEHHAWLCITLIIRNQGKVMLNVGRARVTVKQVLPLAPGLASIIEKSDKSEEILTNIAALTTSPNRQRTEIPWPVIATRKLDWRKGDITIEPGDIHQMKFDFIIDPRIRLIRVYSFLSDDFLPLREYKDADYKLLNDEINTNRRFKKRRSFGWASREDYDLDSSKLDYQQNLHIIR